MPIKCSIPGCPTKSVKGLGRRLYCIPSAINYTGKACPLRETRRKKWISILKLEHLLDHQLKNIRICGEHFVSGKPADQYFEDHPDWVPSLKLNIKESKAATQAKNEFLNNLRLDVTKKIAASNSKKTYIDGTSDLSEEIPKYSMPQKRCCVISCLNRMSKTKNASPPIYYHKFPEDLLTKFRWMFLCQKKGTWDPDQCYICSDHFSSNNYVKDGELKKFSVPTCNLLSEEEKLIKLEKRTGACSIPWCKSNKAEGSIMTTFPEEVDEIKIWINNIFGDEVPVVPADGAYVCEDHFAENQWMKAFGDRQLIKNATPSIFYIPAPSIPIKKKTDTVSPIKKKVGTTSSRILNNIELIKDLKLDNLSEKSDVDCVVKLLKDNIIFKQLNCDSNSTITNNLPTEKVVKILKMVKRQHLEDHAYNKNNFKKRKLLLNNLINKTIKTDANSKDNKINDEAPKNTLKEAPKTPEKTSNSDDCSEFSETNSEDEISSDKLSAKDEKALNELAEAQIFQLDDLKSENKELIEENERLRNEIVLLKLDSKFPSVINEKNKILSNVVSLLKNFLNVDQILSLVKRDPSSTIVWSNETLDKAYEIHKACSDNGYDKLIELGYPLPSRRLISMLKKNESNVNVSSTDEI